MPCILSHACILKHACTLRQAYDRALPGASQKIGRAELGTKRTEPCPPPQNAKGRPPRRPAQRIPMGSEWSQAVRGCEVNPVQGILYQILLIPPHPITPTTRHCVASWRPLTQHWKAPLQLYPTSMWELHNGGWSASKSELEAAQDPYAGLIFRTGRLPCGPVRCPKHQNRRE